jgi:hypothetical protein
LGGFFAKNSPVAMVLCRDQLLCFLLIRGVRRGNGASEEFRFGPVTGGFNTEVVSFQAVRTPVNGGVESFEPGVTKYDAIAP